jgi:hypothetical protein
MEQYQEQTPQNEAPYRRRVAGKHMKINFGSYSGRMSGEFQPI